MRGNKEPLHVHVFSMRTGCVKNIEFNRVSAIVVIIIIIIIIFNGCWRRCYTSGSGGRKHLIASYKKLKEDNTSLPNVDDF